MLHAYNVKKDFQLIMDLAFLVISIANLTLMVSANHVPKVTISMQIKNVRSIKMAAFMKQVFANSVLLLSSTLQIQRIVLSMLASKQTL